MNRRIAILGCGKIGESLLGGLLSAGWREPSEVVARYREEDPESDDDGPEGSERVVLQVQILPRLEGGEEA